MEPGGQLDYWRKYFRSSNSDIINVIENAIFVAASDCPNEFYKHRCRIAEKLFSCRVSRCSGCNHIELQVPVVEEEEEEEDGELREDRDDTREKGSSDDAHAVVTQIASNCSYDEADALTEEIEEESQTVGEVLRIKEVLERKQDESDSVLLDSLRRLQLMRLSVETLKATEIGKAVNGLRKHNLKQIRNLVKTLIDGWRVMVDEWVEATAAIVHEEATPDSLNPSTIDDEGLPFTPLDVGALVATQTTPGKVSQSFGGIDDNNNRRNHVEWENKPENRRPNFDNAHNPVRKHPLHPSDFCEDKDHMRTDDVKRQVKQQQTLKQTEPQEVANKPTRMQESFYRRPKSMYGAELDSGPGRPNLNNNRKPLGQVKSQAVDAGFRKKPQSVVPDKARSSDDNSVRAKLEIAKRKLQEGYQQADNAKKQRTIQVTQMHDLPKQGVNPRQPQVKQGNHNRQWQSGRR